MQGKFYQYKDNKGTNWPLYGNMQIYAQSMTEFILKHNYFEFDGKHYLQRKGTAMGTKMAPVYANIYMAVLEEDFLSKCTLQPSMYLRYIDDIINLAT